MYVVAVTGEDQALLSAGTGVIGDEVLIVGQWNELPHGLAVRHQSRQPTGKATVRSGAPVVARGVARGPIAAEDEALRPAAGSIGNDGVEAAGRVWNLAVERARSEDR